MIYLSTKIIQDKTGEKKMEKYTADEMKKLRYLLTRRQFDALFGKVPMTQYLFDKIMDNTVGMELDEFIPTFMLEYPELMLNHHNKPEYIDDSEIYQVAMEEYIEELDEKWEKMCEKMK